MPPDGVEEAVERGDVPVAGADGPGVERKIGQIALQQWPAEVGQPGCGDLRPGQEAGESGDREQVDDDLVDAAADAQPPSDEPFGRVLEPLLRDPVEPQALAALQPQPPQLPDIAGELRFPPTADLQVLDVAVRVAEERQLPVLLVPGVQVFVEERGPPAGRPVQQGSDSAGGGQGDGAADGPAGGAGLPLVVAALQRVLQFQLELAAVGQGTEVEPVIAFGLADHDELVEVGAPHELPPGLVVDAERRVSLPPEGAERQQADRATLVVDGGQGGQPGRAVWFPGTFPEAVMADAKAPPCPAEAASGDHAFGQLFAAKQVGNG